MANRTPFQTATSASYTVPSKDSEAKKGLSHHIASGFVTNGMAAKEAALERVDAKQWYLMVRIADLKSLGNTWI
jgi:hypothetical protein